ncbi:site-2 protease family protein [Candidatus Kaiserbacteria bacterium]|nr:site-2 protease family protein [Candidatus Kaiserbacteria bacterium]
MLIALTIVVLIFSIIAHEVAHGYAADALGDPTARLAGRLTLNPLPHLDLMGSILIPALLIFSGSPILFGWAKPVPYNPFNLRGPWGLPAQAGEFLVAIAGAATNIVLAIIFGLIARWAGGAGLPASAVALAGTIAFVNLFLGMFNLIPFPPLDGFTALRSALPWDISARFVRFEARVRASGSLALILFLLVFSYVLANPFFNLVSWTFRLIVGS